MSHCTVVYMISANPNKISSKDGTWKQNPRTGGYGWKICQDINVSYPSRLIILDYFFCFILFYVFEIMEKKGWLFLPDWWPEISIYNFLSSCFTHFLLSLQVVLFYFEAVLRHGGETWNCHSTLLNRSLLAYSWALRGRMAKAFPLPTAPIMPCISG